MDDLIFWAQKIWGYVLFFYAIFSFILRLLPSRTFEINSHTAGGRARYWIQQKSLWKPKISYVSHRDEHKKLASQHLILRDGYKIFYLNVNSFTNELRETIESITIYTFKHSWLDVFNGILKDKSPEEIEEPTANHMFPTPQSRHFYSIEHHVYDQSNLLTGINRDSKIKLDKLIDGFIKSKDMCYKNNAVWSLGLILNGPPGTGKTHTAQMYAAHLKHDAYFCFSLANINAIDAIGGMTIKDQTEPFFIVVEDVDRIFEAADRPKIKEPIPRIDDDDDDYYEDDEESYSSGEIPLLVVNSPSGENQTKKGELLQELLNLVDGHNTPYGSIFIFTCNDIDKLPEALVNRCQVVNISEVTQEQVEEICIAWGRDPSSYQGIRNLRELKRRLFEDTCDVV